MGAELQVLLVDDHAVVREGYHRLLERTPDIRVAAEADNGEEAYRLFCERPIDVVVMDISLPGISGLEATRRMLARSPQARVLIFSMNEDPMFVSRALQAGARGYVTKASAPDVLVEAVRAVANGRPYISHDVAQQLALQGLPAGRTPLDELSSREFEVFRLLAEGRSLTEIAKLLCLSHKTVANYQSSIRQKLELSNSVQIVKMATSHGLLD
jgi:two-component system, NarL family, invasion response regulator UvrY